VALSHGSREEFEDGEDLLARGDREDESRDETIRARGTPAGKVGHGRHVGDPRRPLALPHPADEVMTVRHGGSEAGRAKLPAFGLGKERLATAHESGPRRPGKPNLSQRPSPELTDLLQAGGGKSGHARRVACRGGYVP